MIQLKNKKIIAVISIALLIILAAAWFLFLRKNLSNKNYLNYRNNINTPGRLLTEEEKEMVGISEDQQAELVNKKEGLFIYKVVK